MQNTRLILDKKIGHPSLSCTPLVKALIYWPRGRLISNLKEDTVYFVWIELIAPIPNEGVNRETSTSALIWTQSLRHPNSRKTHAWHDIELNLMSMKENCHVSSTEAEKITVSLGQKFLLNLPILNFKFIIRGCLVSLMVVHALTLSDLYSSWKILE